MTLQHNAQRQSQTEATSPRREGSEPEDSADEGSGMEPERKSIPISLSASSSGYRGEHSGQKEDNPPSPATNTQHEIRGCYGDASSTSQHATYESPNLPKLQVPPCLSVHDAVHLLDNVTLQPPVTTETLQELDLHWVQNNVDLRVDINYDHELHFMPISGQRGERKHQETNRYWRCLELELCVYQHNARQNCSACQIQLGVSSTPIVTFAPRLSTMLEALRNLLLTLVPEGDRDEVEQAFDVELLMQQVHNNALDILRLSDWLRSLLTAHCAPVRDTWAEEMSALLCDGARQGHTATIVAGLAKLFELCEAMKLDVSNHQIRSFRTLLIEDGISFQRDYFSTRVWNNKLDVASSHEWFACHEHSLLAKGAQIPDGLDVLVEGLIELCTVPGLALPITFKYDTTRMRQIQEEIQDIVSLGICIDVFEHTVHRFTSIAANLSPMHGILKTRIMDLTDVQVDSEDIATDLWQGSTEAISIEITRAVSSLAQRAKKVPDPNMQQYVARELARCFQAEQSNREHVSIFAIDLKQRISDHATAFRKLSALNISEVQKHYQQKRQPKTSIRLLPDADDIARRLAHMIVIHWEVWGDIAYRVDGTLQTIV